jgi:hypothetical protein
MEEREIDRTWITASVEVVVGVLAVVVAEVDPSYVKKSHPQKLSEKRIITRKDNAFFFI